MWEAILLTSSLNVATGNILVTKPGMGLVPDQGYRYSSFNCNELKCIDKNSPNVR